MGKRCTKIEKANRVNHFVRMISNGAVNSEMERYAAVEWGLSKRRAEAYMKLAREKVMEDINKDRKEVIAELLHGAHTIWKAAARDKQYNNALGAMNLITRLGGLEPK